MRKIRFSQKQFALLCAVVLVAVSVVAMVRQSGWMSDAQRELGGNTTKTEAQMTDAADKINQKDNIKKDRSDEDLLFQVMLDLGIPLSAKIRQIGDVYYVNDTYLIACFKQVDTALITEIAKQKPYYSVFRDSSFTSDSAMVNFEQVFNTYSPNTIRRVL